MAETQGEAGVGAAPALGRVLLVQSDARQIPLRDESVHCVVTSPVYWGLRSYGIGVENGELGLEDMHDCNGAFTGQSCGACYLCHMRQVFREVWRVLRPDGTCWIVIGDSYNAAGRNGHGTRIGYKQGTNRASANGHDTHRSTVATLGEKNLCGIPWRLALALQQPYPVPTCVKSERDRAWLAAMFDGEGTISIRRYHSWRPEVRQIYQDGFTPFASVANSDVELLEHCVALTGYGAPRIKWKGKAGDIDRRGIVTRRDNYGWRIDANQAVDVIRAIYPYLIIKRKQACLAYTLDQINKRGRSERGNKPVSIETQEKKRLLWELVKKCNQREPVDIPSWVEEPQQEIQPGWTLRSDIIWSKPNPMPGSQQDRPTTSHEYVFLLSKEARYFYDAQAIAEPLTDYGQRGTDSTYQQVPNGGDNAGLGALAKRIRQARIDGDHTLTRTARDVWTLATQPCPLAHFATFPEELAARCIKAGTSAYGVCSACGAPWRRVVKHVGTGRVYARGACAADYRALGSPQHTGSGSGALSVQSITTGWQPTCTCHASVTSAIVLDPFAGSGTTGLAARALGRSALLLDLSLPYLRDIARERLGLAALQEWEHGATPQPVTYDDLPLFSLGGEVGK